MANTNEKMCICVSAGKCGTKLNCPHRVPHLRNSNCTKKCWHADELKIEANCVEVEGEDWKLGASNVR
jgi:hypothetical protein